MPSEPVKEPVRKAPEMPAEEQTAEEIPQEPDPDHPDQMALQLPEPPPDTGLLPEWAEVLDRVKKKNLMLGSVLQHSKAHLEGRHVLIEANDVAMRFIRENSDSNQTLKEAIAEVTGKYYPIGPWKKKEEQPTVNNDDLQRLLDSAESAGVDIVR